MNTLNLIPPDQLTVLDLVEIQSQPNRERVLHHYKGELLYGKLHFCLECDRKFKVREFFMDFEMAWTREDGDGEMHELREREHLLSISQAEWNANRQMLDRVEMERGGFDF